jgi:Condensin II complex subunit CAP-H2 or CNDH2, C-term
VYLLAALIAPIHTIAADTNAATREPMTIVRCVTRTQYAQETHLSRRVSAWQSKLEPLLRAQSERRAFDMRACGDAVLARAVAVLPRETRLRLEAGGTASDKLSADSSSTSKDDVVSFGQVVAGRER